MPLIKKASKEEEFWAYFQKNEDSIFNFEKDQEKTFRNLHAAMMKVNKDLVFEFSAVNDGKREFVISAGGIKAAFPAVESLFNAAPSLQRWTWIKFRPRRDTDILQIGDVQCGPDDIEISMKPDNGKMGIHVFIRGYCQEKARAYMQLAYVFLDHTIGEYDMETRVGFIEFHPFEEAGPDKRHKLNDFPVAFDGYFSNQNP